MNTVAAITPIATVLTGYALFLRPETKAHWNFCQGPNDEVANEQQDLAHHMYLVTLDGLLHLAPIENPQVFLPVHMDGYLT